MLKQKKPVRRNGVLLLEILFDQLHKTRFFLVYFSSVVIWVNEEI